MPDMNQEKKKPQNISFVVSKPVYYDGVLIIRQGARAGGMITIGRIRTDIEISYVEAANGNRINLKAETDHGRRDDIHSGGSFTAMVQQGTRLSF